MKKTIIVVCMVLAVTAGLWAGGRSEQSSTRDPGELRVALLLSGPANDQGWNQVALQGLQDAEAQFGIRTAYSEYVDVAESEAAFNDYASQGYDLIIGHGYQYGDPAVRVGQRFPNTYFVAIESASQSANVASYVLAAEQASFLTGYIAASVSTSGHLGIVGGVEQPSIVKIVEAFKLGAREYNPGIKVTDIYIGSFTDAALGQDAGISLADQGADVLAHVANQAGIGVIRAAEERGLLAIGDSYDQSSIAPNTVVTSNIYNVPLLVLTAVEHVREGSFEGGILHLGMELGVIDIAPFHGMASVVPEAAQRRVEELKSGIIAGTVRVPRVESRTQ